MSERKVLNKYYPPDFDPSKIPRMKLARNRQYTVRLMAPFNMRCMTCGEYIYKGKKFNARKEDVEGDDYLGIRIYRFYIKCTRCLQEISFKTDPKNTDYEIEAGATRNFMALKLAEEQAQREEDEEKEEEATNPMKLLEKRTQQSKQELELLESLEELKDLNRRQQTIDYDQMLAQYDSEAARQKALDEQERLDEEYVKSIFGKRKLDEAVVKEEIVELITDESSESRKKVLKSDENKEKLQPSGSSCGPSASNNESNEVEQAKKKIDPKFNNSTRTSNTSNSSLRNTLSKLIKKKSPETKNAVETPESSTTVVENVKSTDVSGKSGNSASNSTSEETKGNGLSLLCSYSDSSENESE